jgi:hypothetical protein
MLTSKLRITQQTKISISTQNLKAYKIQIKQFKPYSTSQTSKSYKARKINFKIRQNPGQQHPKTKNQLTRLPSLKSSLNDVCTNFQICSRCGFGVPKRRGFSEFKQMKQFRNASSNRSRSSGRFRLKNVNWKLNFYLRSNKCELETECQVFCMPKKYSNMSNFAHVHKTFARTKMNWNPNVNFCYVHKNSMIKYT